MFGNVAGPLHGIGDEQHPALFHAGIAIKPAGEFKGGTGATALHRHHGGMQRADEIGDGAGVVRQRRDHMRIAGVGDERGQTFLALPEQVRELVSRPRHARRRHVFRKHGHGHVEDNHEAIRALRHGFGESLPSGAGEGQDRERSGCGEEFGSRAPALVALFEQHAQ